MPVMLIALVWLYAAGVRALWRAAGKDRGLRTWQVACFGGGMLALSLALLSPLDVYAETSFAAHMSQHLLLMTVAAPLFALAAPEVALLWALCHRERVAIGRLIHSARGLRVLGTLPVAFGLHSIALWLWHAPLLYEAALRQVALHSLEHVTLLGTGWLFWTAAFAGMRRAGRPNASAILYVFVLGAQCTGLGALITLSPRAWYPSYPSLQDQVLAGVLMWVPAGLVYLSLALLLLGAWLRPLERGFNRAGAGRLRPPPAPRSEAPEWR